MATSEDNFAGAYADITTEILIFNPIIKKLGRLDVKTLSLTEAKVHLKNLSFSNASLDKNYREFVKTKVELDSELTKEEQIKFAEVEGKVSALKDLAVKCEISLQGFVDNNMISQTVKDSSTDDNFSFSQYKHLLPKIDIAKFSGNNNDQALEYFSFKTAFDDIITNKPKIPDSIKFLYLKSFLNGYALKIVQHLTTCDANFQNAFDLLDKEFLNKEAITDLLMSKLLRLTPKYDKDDFRFINIKVFINEVRAVLNDLTVNSITLQADPSANKFLSHIIFSKLPFVFKQELIRKSNSNYPCIEDIFEHYPDIIHQLNLKSKNFPVKPKNVNGAGNQNVSGVNSVVARKPKQSNSEVASSKIDTAVIKKESPELAKIGDVQSKRFCKFCNKDDHSSLRCLTYTSLKERIDRLKVLNLCSKCFGSNHLTASCKFNTQLFPFKCFICNKQNHCSPLCDSKKELNNK